MNASALRISLLAVMAGVPADIASAADELVVYAEATLALLAGIGPEW